MSVLLHLLLHLLAAAATSPAAKSPAENTARPPSTSPAAVEPDESLLRLGVVVSKQGLQDLAMAASPSPVTGEEADSDRSLLRLGPILSKLGFDEIAMATPLLASPILSTWSGPLTVFAASDSSAVSCQSCSRSHLLRDHVAPGLLTFAALAALPSPSKLASASPSRCLTLTSGGGAGADRRLFVDGVEITQPDLYNDGRFVVHGIQGFLAPLSPSSCLPAAGARSTGSGYEPVTRVMIRDAIVRLRGGGYGFLALAMLSHVTDLEKITNMTVFAVSDQAVFFGAGSGSSYVTDLRFHVVPNHRLDLDELRRLPPGSMLPTLAAGKHLVVTQGADSTGRGLRINYVPVNPPDAVVNSRVAVHGVVVPFPHLYLADLVAGRVEEAAAPPPPCNTGVPYGRCFPLANSSGLGDRSSEKERSVMS